MRATIDSKEIKLDTIVTKDKPEITIIGANTIKEYPMLLKGRLEERKKSKYEENKIKSI